MAGSAQIGALRVALGLDTAQFEAGLKKSQRDLDAFGRGTSTALEELRAGFQSTAGKAGVFGSVLSSMGVVGVAAAVGLGGVAVALEKARAAMAFGDEIGDTAAKLAVSTDRLQEYRYAIHQLGGEYKDADAALEGFSQSFGAALNGISKKAARPFLALGLDPKTLGDTEHALDAVIDKIAHIANPAQQQAMADAFGMGSMLPAIRAGVPEIERLQKAAHDLGFVMDKDLIEKASTANDRMEDLHQVLSVQINSAMVELAPLVLGVASGLTTAAGAANQFAGALNDLNKWSANNDILAMYRWANQAGTATGKALHTDWVGPALGMGAKRAPASAPAAGLSQADRDAIATPPTHVRNFADEQAAAAAAAKAAAAAAKAAARVAASEQAIDGATVAELQARMGLTRDVQALAALKVAEVGSENKKANDRLSSDAAAGKITTASAAIAIALNDRATAEQKALIEREAQQQRDDDALAQAQKIAGYRDQIASIQASLATNADDQNSIEEKALSERQDHERKVLAHDQAEEILWGKGNDADRAAVAAQLEIRQAAETEAMQRATSARVQAESHQAAEAALQLVIDQLTSQQAAAETEVARVGIGQSILAAEQKLERLKLEEVAYAAEGTVADADRADAKKRLAALEGLQANDRKAAAGTLQSNFEAASNALGGMADAFKSHNWGALVSSLDNAFASLKKAFGPGGTLQTKIGAISGLGIAAGRAIGGTGGSALSGLAGGAALGAQLGSVVPGIGTAIGAGVGAVLGGIAGLFGGGSAKKKAKAEAAQKAADEAAAKAIEIANDERAAEIELVRQTKGDVAALAMQRDDELAAARALDPALADLKQQLFDAQDAATAAAKALEVATTARGIEIDTLNALGRAGEATALTREDELAALEKIDPSLVSLKQGLYDAQDAAAAAAAAIDASAQASEAMSKALEVSNANRSKEADLIELAGDAAGATALRRKLELDAMEPALQSFQRLVNAAQDAAATRDKFKGFADGIDAVLKQISGGAGQSLQDIGAQFRSAGNRARLGDEAAFGELQDLAPTMAEAVQANAGSAVEAARGLAGVRNTLLAAQSTALNHVAIAQQELDQLAYIGGNMADIDTTMLTVNDALAALNETQGLALEQETLSSTGIAGLGVKLDTLNGSIQSMGATLAQNTRDTAAALVGATTEGGLVLNVVAA